MVREAGCISKIEKALNRCSNAFFQAEIRVGKLYTARLKVSTKPLVMLPVTVASYAPTVSSLNMLSDLLYV
jgi:hypothetical protein